MRSSPFASREASGRKGAQSVSDESEIFGDDSGAGVSAQECAYIEAIRQKVDEGKVPYGVLPQSFVPEVAWEPVSESDPQVAIFPRFSHGLVALLAPSGKFGACNAGQASAGERILGLGGRQAFLEEDPESSLSRSWLQQDSRGAPPGQDFTTTTFGMRRVGQSQQASWEVQCLPTTVDQIPRKLSGSVVCATSCGSEVVVFGGLDLEAEQVSSSVFVLDVPSGAWRECTGLPRAPEAFLYAAGAAVEGRAVLIHGGCVSDNDAPVNDLRRFDISGAGAAWHEVGLLPTSELAGIADTSLTRIPARKAHTMCVFNGEGCNSRVIFFGGFDSENEVTSESFIFDLDRGIKLATSTTGAQPVARAHHTATRLGPYMAVFGGVTENGDICGDLRLLHLPTMIWTAPDVGMSLGWEGRSPDDTEPESFRRRPSSRASSKGGKSAARMPKHRSQHGAVALSRGLKPGECCMLIFGGHDGCGQPLRDMHRMVLQLPKVGLPSNDVRPQLDKAYELTATNLERTLAGLAAHHTKELEDCRTRQKHIEEEARHVETRTLGVKAQADRHVDARAAEQEKEDALRRRMQEEEAQLEDMRVEHKKRLLELEAEVDSLEGEIYRLRNDPDLEFQGLMHTSEVEWEAWAQVSSHANELAPEGWVERGNASWHGAQISIEVYRFPHLAPPRPPTPDARPEGESEQEPSSQRAQGQSHRGRGAVLGSLEEELAALTAEFENWQDAVQRETGIVSMLRHPNVQAIYGTIIDKTGLYFLTEPYLESLAARLAQDEKIINQRKPLAATESSVSRTTEALRVGQRLHISLDLACALRYLHSQGVAHRHVVVDNAFLRDQAGIGLVAKLGGHFGARVCCRKTSRWCVPGEATEQLEPDDPALAPVTQQRMCNFDARPLDVRALGGVLLRLWTAKDKPKRATHYDRFYEDRAENKEDTTIMKDERGHSLATLSADLVQQICDSSLRLCVAACLTSRDVDRPSAASVHAALYAIQERDITEMPSLTQDESRQAQLADIAGDLSSEEET